MTVIHYQLRNLKYSGERVWGNFEATKATPTFPHDLHLRLTVPGRSITATAVLEPLLDGLATLSAAFVDETHELIGIALNLGQVIVG